ncbi:uncharacterized protein LOC128677508 [Plodia interpunctella]|uniref:uncharacterized protein LOC128677508 n=1 Tax=Plodia interpunctella TaxID=58824 RepID=UPI00236897BB|nr:uncharacterized protein LOC128677508 [Plodia interpunctella]
MLNLVLFFGLGISFINAEEKTKERKASLIVLPPLVLGYDELYQDALSAENANPEPVAPQGAARKGPVKITKMPNSDMNSDSVIEKENVKYLENTYLNNSHYSDSPSEEYYNDLSEGLDIEKNRTDEEKRAYERNEEKDLSIEAKVLAKARFNDFPVIVEKNDRDDIKVRGFKVPDVKVSNFKMPDTKVTDIKVSNLKVPDTKLPDIKLPDIKLSDIKMLDIKVPDIKVPDSKMPNGRKGRFRRSLQEEHTTCPCQAG